MLPYKGCHHLATFSTPCGQCVFLEREERKMSTWPCTKIIIQARHGHLNPQFSSLVTLSIMVKYMCSSLFLSWMGVFIAILLFLFYYYWLFCWWLNLSFSHRVYDHKEPCLNLVKRNRCHFEILDLEMMLYVCLINSVLSLMGECLWMHLGKLHYFWC